MRPILFEIPGLGYPVHAFSVLLVLGAAAGVYLTAWRAKRVGINPDVVYELAVWVLGGGFVGARIYYLVQHPDSVHSPLDVFKVWQGGIVFYGCIMGGLVGTWIYHRRHPFPFWPMADAVAPALAIGVLLGRVGCFLNGCCFGAVCDPHAFYAVSFPAESLPWLRHVDAGWIGPDAPHSLPIHPKQLYGAFSGLVLLVATGLFYPFRRRDGEVMALVMIGYPVTRFLMEFARGDATGWHLGLTVSQYISLGLFAAGLVAWRSLPACPGGLYADRQATRAQAQVREQDGSPHRPMGGAPGRRSDRSSVLR